MKTEDKVGMDKELLPSCPLCCSVDHECKDCAWKAVIGIKCYLFAEAHFLIPQDEGLSRARNFNSRWWKHRKIALRRWILLYRMAAKLIHEVK